MQVKIGKFPKGSSYQKISVKIDKHDTWSLDHTLASIILPALIQLKHTKQGIPGEFTNRIGGDFDRNLVFDFIKEDDDQVFDQLCQEWDEILDKMIWSFLQLSIEDDYDHQYHHGKMNVEWTKSEYTYTDPVTGKTESTYKMIDKNPGSHWYDYVGQEVHDERIQEGLELFGKYFRNLWD